MKIPSKVTPYKESTIAKFPVILSLLEQNDMTPNELYAKVKKSKVKDIAEFVEVLDCLYAMNKEWTGPGAHQISRWSQCCIGR